MGFRGPILLLVGLDSFCPLIGPGGVRLWDLWGGARRTHGAGLGGSTHRHPISERLQELTTHLRPVFDFREGVQKWLPCKHISGVWAQGTPQSQTLAPYLAF